MPCTNEKGWQNTSATHRHRPRFQARFQQFENKKLTRWKIPINLNPRQRLKPLKVSELRHWLHLITKPGVGERSTQSSNCTLFLHPALYCHRIKPTDQKQSEPPVTYVASKKGCQFFTIRYYWQINATTNEFSSNNMTNAQLKSFNHSH